jgi:hypothetical protein
MPTDFWAALEQELGGGIQPPERKMLKRRGYASQYEQEVDVGDRLDTVQDSASFVRDLREVYGESVETKAIEPYAAGGVQDGRWALLAELEEARESLRTDKSSEPFKEPLRISRVCSPRSMSPRRITVTFDNRLSQQTLVRALRRTWPTLAREGWIRRTRPLDERTVDLLRFVCLETPPEWTWRARLAEWDRTRPQYPYAGVRPFESAFRRAEEALTGERRGLAWFFDRTSRYSDGAALHDLADEARRLSAEIRDLEAQEQTPDVVQNLDQARERMVGLGPRLNAILGALTHQYKAAHAQWESDSSHSSKARRQKDDSPSEDGA